MKPELSSIGAPARRLIWSPWRLALTAALTIIAFSVSGAVDPFTFAHISDTHIGGGPEHAKWLRNVLTDIRTHYPETEFIISTGDTTEFGYNDQFAEYKAIKAECPIPIHECIGNHDVRWSESGKENFRNSLGPTYVSFDHKGVHFVLMDVTVLIEQYAHFDGIQMKQLHDELDHLNGGPAVICMHHPPLSTGHFTDNEYEFASLIGRYNVPLVCTGHGHAFQRYTFNGTSYCMGGSTSTGADHHAYRIYRVNADHIDCIRRKLDDDKTTTDATIALAGRNAGNDIFSRSSTPRESRQDMATLGFSVKPQSGNFKTTYLVDKTLTGSMDASGGFPINFAALGAGRHQFVANVTANGESFCRADYFNTAPTTGPKIVRSFPLDSGCQSHPALDGDVLYVGANDHFLRAFDLVQGKELWRADLQREIISSPVVTSDTVIVGSLDRQIYCLDKHSGKTVWSYETSGSILASPLVNADVVYCGSGDYNLYALKAKTGELLWKFPTGKLVKATPALSNGKLFFGSWDNWIYCVNANSGELIWKVPASTGTRFAAATCNPLALGGRLFVCTHDYCMRCLDQANGSHIWMYKPKIDENGPSYSSPVAYKGSVYLGSINGHVVGFNFETGEKTLDLDVRPAKADPFFDSIPLLDNGRLYLGSVGGNLYCIDLNAKKVAWSIALQPGYIFTRPVLWKGHVLVGSMDDKVYEVDPGEAGRIATGAEAQMTTATATAKPRAKAGRKVRRAR